MCNYLILILFSIIALGVFPWTVILVEDREAYMQALEIASVQQDITPIAAFLGKLVNQAMLGLPAAKI